MIKKKFKKKLKKIFRKFLPDPPNPVGSYTAFKKVGNLLFVSGQISLEANGNLIKGKVGLNLDLEMGRKAARACCINIIAQLKKACEGDFSKIKSCIQLSGYVNSSDDFVDQPKVINGASELMKKFLKILVYILEQQ